MNFQLGWLPLFSVCCTLALTWSDSPLICEQRLWILFLIRGVRAAFLIKINLTHSLSPEMKWSHSWPADNFSIFWKFKCAIDLKSKGALIEIFMCKFKCFANQDQEAWHSTVSSIENAKVKLLPNECWHWLNDLYTKLHFTNSNDMCHCCRKEGLTMQTSRADTEQLWEQINAKRGLLEVKK